MTIASHQNPLLIDGHPIQKQFVERVCKLMNVEASRVVQLSVQKDPFRDSVEVRIKLGPLKLPDNLRQVLGRIDQLMNDEFRGGVIRAAVPELSRHIDELFSLAGKTQGTEYIRVPSNMVYDFLKEFHGSERLFADLGLGSKTFHYPPG